MRPLSFRSVPSDAVGIQLCRLLRWFVRVGVGCICVVELHRLCGGHFVRCWFGLLLGVRNRLLFCLADKCVCHVRSGHLRCGIACVELLGLRRGHVLDHHGCVFVDELRELRRRDFLRLGVEDVRGLRLWEVLSGWRLELHELLGRALSRRR